MQRTNGTIGVSGLFIGTVDSVDFGDPMVGEVGVIHNHTRIDFYNRPTPKSDTTNWGIRSYTATQNGNLWLWNPKDRSLGVIGRWK